jgi:S-layer family protein
MRAFRALMVVLIATQVTWLAALPAAAQAVDSVPCPTGIPSAGFVDVASNSIHLHDIDCISLLGITTQVGTYNPEGSVTREQMALFLVRSFEWVANLPPGSPRGFTDVSGLSTESQLAIHQLAELSVTTGVSSTLFDPLATVTREQMALFLARTIRAASVDLPDGTDQGFADIGSLGSESRQAINQMRQLGITTGTTATTFDPGGLVNRQQMASFLARMMKVVWRFSLIGDFALTCNPALELNIVGTSCTGSGTWPGGVTFRVLEGFAVNLPGDPSPLNAANFVLTMDGVSVPLREKNTILNGIQFRVWEASFPGGLTGPHTFTGQWFGGSVLETTVTLTVDFVS